MLDVNLKQIIAKLNNLYNGDSFNIQKKEVLDMLSKSIERLKSDAIPMLADLERETGFKTVSVKYLETITDSYNKYLHNKSKIPSSKYLSNLHATIDKIIDLEVALTNLVNGSFKATTTELTITIKEAAVYNFIKKIEFISFYCIDLFLLIMDSAEGKYRVHKVIRERILHDIPTFNTYIVELRPERIDKLIVDLTTNSNVNVGRLEEKSDILADVLDLTNTKINGIDSVGFIGNPFYHIRKFFADRDHKYYNLCKAKKDQYNLLVANLRLKQQGETDPKIDNEINYYTKKIMKLEKEIDEYLKSINE